MSVFNVFLRLSVLERLRIFLNTDISNISVEVIHVDACISAVSNRLASSLHVFCSEHECLYR